MSWQRLLETGLGSVRMRLALQGHPDEFVSHPEMELAADPANDVRARLSLLASRAIRLSERVSLVDAKIDNSGFTADIVDVRKRATASFRTAPTLRTLLAADLTWNATTATVLSTEGWPTSGLLWLDTEVIYYTGKTATTFTGLVRGQMGTRARAHYYESSTGDAREPEITNRPVTLEGRRATLYVYGDGDDPQGAGTQIWRGVVATQPRYSGTRYSMLLDPITRVLKQTVGGFLDTPAAPRGIYYSRENPCFIHIEEMPGAHTHSGPVGSPGWSQIKFAMYGFWETQDDFIAALQDQITGNVTLGIAARWTGNSTITVGRHGDSWCIRFTTDASDPRLVLMGTADNPDPPLVSYTDGGFSMLPVVESTGAEVGMEGAPVLAGETYLHALAPPWRNGGLRAPGTVPRTTWGAPGGPDPRRIDELPLVDRVVYGGNFRAYRLYLDAPFLDTSFQRMVVSFEANGSGTEDELNEAISVNGPNRYVERLHGSSFYVVTAANIPEVEFLFVAAVGSLPEFIAALINDSRDYCNLGLACDLEPDDFDLDAMAELREAGARGFLRRTYGFFAAQELDEVLVEEAKLYGAYPYITSDGKISFRLLRHASQVEAPDAVIDTARHVVSSEWVHHEPQPLGVYNTVVIKTGYDPIEDEHTGRQWVVRDKRAYGRSPIARTLEIAPLSQHSSPERTYEEILSIVQRIFGLFAGEYSVLQLEVSPRLFNVYLGDVVSVTSPKVPNADGTLGIEAKRGILISREWALREDGGTGTLQILMTDAPHAAYSPACRIESAVRRESTVYDLALGVHMARYFPAGTFAVDWFAPGDLIRVSDWNGSTIGTVLGTVSAINPAPGYDLQVKLASDATALETHPSFIAYRRPSAIPIDHAGGGRVQHAFGAIAGPDGIIRWDGFDTGHRVFAP